MWWQCLKEQRNGQKFISVTTLVSEEWLDKIYNIRKCKISKKTEVFKDKISCYSRRENRIPKQELTFLSDQKACLTISLN